MDMRKNTIGGIYNIHRDFWQIYTFLRASILGIGSYYPFFLHTWKIQWIDTFAIDLNSWTEYLCIPTGIFNFVLKYEKKLGDL